VTGGYTGGVGDNPEIDQHPIQEGVEMLLVASCCRNYSCSEISAGLMGRPYLNITLPS